VAAPPYLYSGPSPVASLATALKGLDINDRRGDDLRARIHHMTWRVLETLEGLGAHTPNRSGYPIVEVPLARYEDIDAAGRFLFERGVYVTVAAYPLVPKHEVGFRIQVTAANTAQQIEHLCETLTDLAGRFRLRPREDAGGRSPGLG
jgi:7-keto-8-aminopelargonate synthetase-like enzyme